MSSAAKFGYIFRGKAILIKQYLLSSGDRMKADFYDEIRRLNKSCAGKADIALTREGFHTVFSLLQRESVAENDDRYIFALFSLRNFLRKAYLSPDRPKRRTRINVGAFINALTVSCSFCSATAIKRRLRFRFRRTFPPRRTTFCFRCRRGNYR